MDIEKKNLYVFGYGVAVLIPFLLFMGIIKDQLSFGWFLLVLLGGFSVVMWLAVMAASINRWVNLWIIVPAVYVLLARLQDGAGWGSIILTSIALLFLIITIFQINFLRPIYDKWMMVAHIIGTTIMSILLIILFYGVFGIVGILFRIVGKDLLDEKLDENVVSYWQDKSDEAIDKKSFEVQF